MRSPLPLCPLVMVSVLLLGSCAGQTGFDAGLAACSRTSECSAGETCLDGLGTPSSRRDGGSNADAGGTTRRDAGPPLTACRTSDTCPDGLPCVAGGCQADPCASPPEALCAAVSGGSCRARCIPVADPDTSCQMAIPGQWDCLCQPRCPAGSECGAPDGCGGQCNGTYPASNEFCTYTASGLDCVCLPSCATCGGSDGCRGICSVGSCPTPGDVCFGRRCCTPSCPAGVACGTSDGCGGTCPGTCEGADVCLGGGRTYGCTCIPSCSTCGGKVRTLIETSVVPLDQGRSSSMPTRSRARSSSGGARVRLTRPPRIEAASSSRRGQRPRDAERSAGSAASSTMRSRSQRCLASSRRDSV